ncbi:MAG TPA: hypothetical protein VFE62_17090 [Gemmataceae bacterium]|nr:hypothetical protein [Verrucomicrobiae bacterium]HWB10112.1 hypothetical protein [Pirellulales bacterium]HZZ80232.1 hypothetical protein [Gemmataceae bacterium]
MKRVPGYSQEDMRGLWKRFVYETFQRTRFRTPVKGETRPVHRDGMRRLIVLDELHGDLEVLEFQARSGKAKYLGTQEIHVVFEAPPGGGKPIIKEITLSVLKQGKRDHVFELHGSL